jgi:hypothetical protein
VPTGGMICEDHNALVICLNEALPQ